MKLFELSLKFCLRSHSLLHIEQSWDLNPGSLTDGASLVAQVVKNLLAVQETQGQSLGWGDPPWIREWLPTPVFLPGTPRTEEPGGLQSVESQRAGHD